MIWDNYTDLELLEMCIFGEAEGEGLIGQIAVGLVVRNRLKDPLKRFGDGMKRVLLRPLQFSCFNIDSNRIPKMMEFIKTESPLYNQIFWVSKGITTNYIHDDITNGATHYLTKELYQSTRCPYWAKTGIITARIENHIFLKLTNV